jgi:ubiquinone/menaquinone biosynthesis C-methylase UbiE
MSDFSKKAFSGIIPTSEDWEAHLKEVHQASPAMSPVAFAAHLTEVGLNSYEILAHAIEAKAIETTKAFTVMDLACGDGYLTPLCLERIGPTGKLIGVDMTESEIILARKQHTDPRVKFVCAKAQSLPLENESVNAVLSHMALMLMAPIEPVVREISRVLVKGGLFAAIVGAPRKPDSLAAKVSGIIMSFLRRQYPNFPAVKIGDERIHTLEGLRTLFNEETGFSDSVTIQDFALQVEMKPDSFAEFYKDMYLVDILPKEQKAQLLAEIVGFLKEHQTPAGIVSLPFPVRKIEVRKTN